MATRSRLAAAGLIALPPTQLAISFVNGNSNNNTFGTTLTLTQPSGIAAGDVGVLMTNNATPPGGWTGDGTSGLYWKAYGAGEGSIALTSATNKNMVASVSVYRNVHNTTPFDTTSKKNVTTGTTWPTTAITAGFAREMLVCATLGAVSSGTQVLTIPSGYTADTGTNKISGVQYQGIAHLSGTANGASSGTPSWSGTIATAFNNAALIFLRPADT